MSDFVHVGDTIEGARVCITTRKWTPGALVQHQALQKLMYRYKTDKNTVAKVIKQGEVPLDSNTKEATSYYHRAVGDRIICDSATVYVDCVRKVVPTVREGVSHTHGANMVKTKNDTVATINMPIDSIVNRLDKEQSKLISN